jgi:hypothetical protein
MPDIIKCPSCGESNPSNQEFCQYCQNRLQPLSGDPQGTDPTIKPGEIPTKKDTAELEPVLPQWLRDARGSARQADQQEQAEAAQHSKEAESADSSTDLLAGLQSQAGESEEEETPDWLASITGATPTEKEKQEGSSEVRWVELGDKGDFAQGESTKDADADTSSWLAGLTPVESQPDEKDELTDWLHEKSDLQEPQPIEQSPSLDSPSFDSPAGDTPDWLRQMALENEPRDEIEPYAEASEVFSDSPELSIDAPDWLRAMGGVEESSGVEPAVFSEAGSGESEAAESPSTDGIPDWMKEMPEPEEPKQDTTPKWLRDERSGSSDEADLPAWLSKDADSPTPSLPEQEPPPAQDDAALGDIPDWLKAAAPQDSIFSQPEEQPAAEPEPSSDAAADWLDNFTTEDAPQPDAAAAIEQEESFEMPPAFTADSQTGEGMDELFTDMPDWLSNAMDTPAPPSTPSPITNTDAISPGELPSWVQAMRPVDTGISQTPSSSGPSDQTLESRGALAGLQGVLPSVPGFAPTSKPRAYSIKLQSSDEQLAHAELLEQILAAETAPVPIASFSALRTSQSLRWFLAFVVFAVLITALFMRTQTFSMPVGVPNEIGSAVQISQSIPEGAPVLVAFDYEPARVGEMEAAAAPMLDQMILLRHPRLTFISTNATGAILAERFISGPLAGHSYENRVTYLNLGYLPGGQLGIHAFAQNPHVTAPLDMSLEPAWTSAPLDGVTSISQFAALILITDNADAARVWIEQTESARGDLPFVVISSAQAAPMIQPYYESGQINGLVPGLYGGAIFEQYNAGRPGTARMYWDAFSLGMLLAMALILGGGLWNFALGLRDRASAREVN